MINDPIPNITIVKNIRKNPSASNESAISLVNYLNWIATKRIKTEISDKMSIKLSQADLNGLTAML